MMTYYPSTRIRSRGAAGYRNIRMRRRCKGTMIYLGTFLLFALGYVWTRVQVLEAGYRLRGLELAQEQLREENHSLLIEAATLRSPQRLELLAQSMGLQRPVEAQVLFLP